MGDAAEERVGLMTWLVPVSAGKRLSQLREEGTDRKTMQEMEEIEEKKKTRQTIYLATFRFIYCTLEPEAVPFCFPRQFIHLHISPPSSSQS